MCRCMRTRIWQEVLGTLKIGTEIPQELYEVVAEVLAFVSRMDEQAMNRRRPSVAERMQRGAANG